MNNELMEQCLGEAEKLYEMPVLDEHRFVQTTDTAIAAAVVEARREAYAAALYAERSKRRELTDEEIDRIAVEISPEWGISIAIAVLRYARDNGYLSTGLTVEEMHKIGIFLRLFSDVIGDESGEVAQLRARLTEAAYGKP